MRNISTSGKRFKDAIRYKNIQEIKDFKKGHEKLLKQLGTVSRKRKVVDMSLTNVDSGTQETRQNERILSEMINEAKTFDNRLKKMGIKLNVDELIGTKMDDRTAQDLS